MRMTVGAIRILLLGAVLSPLGEWPAYALTQPEREVLVQFRKGVIKPNPQGPILVSEAASSEHVRTVLAGFPIEVFEKAMPSFSPADTVGVSDRGEIVRLNDFSELYRIRLPSEQLLGALIESLSSLPEVVYAERNGLSGYDGSIYPDDDHFVSGAQWGHWNYGQNSGVPDADVDMPEAWGMATGDPSIKVGVLDTGVERTHEDFSGRVSGDDTDASHGTMVAGVLAATGNNDKGVAGVDWGAQILSKNKAGDDVVIAEKVRGLMNEGARVINNSWHLLPEGRHSITVRKAFADVYRANRVAVVAMGNDNTNVPNYPAGFGQGIIAVGATDRSDEKAGFSNIGGHIDVVAPGEGIWTTIPSSPLYATTDGTSFAAPYVSGLASLLLDVNPSLYNDDVERLIGMGIDDLGPDGWDQEFGTGRINAKKTLNLIRAPNIIQHSSVTGGDIVASTGFQDVVFWGPVPELEEGVTYSALKAHG